MRAIFISKNTTYCVEGDFDAGLINTPAFDIGNEKLEESQKQTNGWYIKVAINEVQQVIQQNQQFRKNKKM